MSAVRAFHTDLNSAVVREGMQGQGYVTVISEPESPACFVKIVMPPGKVSMPHVHRRLDVYVTLDVDSPPVLTLWGEEMQNGTWLLPGGTLWIPPKVPHVAILPRRLHGVPITRQAVATEMRVSAIGVLGISPQDDVEPLPGLVSLVSNRIHELSLEMS